MYRTAFGFTLLALAACGPTLTGCSGSGGPTIDTEYVEGVVTLDGEPVPEATVMFVPAAEGGMSATGFSDASGVYKLTVVGTGEATAEAEGGVPPGEYLVGVTKTKVESLLTEEEAEEQGVEYVEPEDDLATGEVTHIVPQKYNNPRKSGIKVTVTEGQNNIPIELSSK